MLDPSAQVTVTRLPRLSQLRGTCLIHKGIIRRRGAYLRLAIGDGISPQTISSPVPPAPCQPLQPLQPLQPEWMVKSSLSFALCRRVQLTDVSVRRSSRFAIPSENLSESCLRDEGRAIYLYVRRLNGRIIWPTCTLNGNSLYPRVSTRYTLQRPLHQPNSPRVSFGTRCTRYARPMAIIQDFEEMRVGRAREQGSRCSLVQLEILSNQCSFLLAPLLKCSRCRQGATHSTRHIRPFTHSPFFTNPPRDPSPSGGGSPDSSITAWACRFGRRHRL